MDGDEGLLNALIDVHKRFGEQISRAELRSDLSSPTAFIELLHSLRQKAARRALIASVLEALESRPAAAVYLVDVPEKHADLCEGVRLLARRAVPCALRDAEEIGADGDDGALVWVYRAAAEERP